jgi:hypothetical protein
VDDVAIPYDPHAPKEAYEAPGLIELGKVDELTATIGGSPVDDS